MNQMNVNFNVFEDSVEYLGVSECTLPDLDALTVTITGAGLGGKVEAVAKAMYDAMSMSMKWLTTTEYALKLSEPRRHNLDLRVAQQSENLTTGELDIIAEKHVMVVIPKKHGGGTLAPASTNDASGEYAVHYWATYLDGKKIREIDPMNNICYINGVDYAADVRTALGK